MRFILLIFLLAWSVAFPAWADDDDDPQAAALPSPAHTQMVNGQRVIIIDSAIQAQNGIEAKPLGTGSYAQSLILTGQVFDSAALANAYTRWHNARDPALRKLYMRTLIERGDAAIAGAVADARSPVIRALTLRQALIAVPGATQPLHLKTESGLDLTRILALDDGRGLYAGGDARSVPAGTTMPVRSQETIAATKIVPSAAVVWRDGKPWAYQRTQTQRFARIPLLVKNDGLHLPPDLGAAEIVIQGAQLLFSEEFRDEIDAGD